MKRLLIGSLATMMIALPVFANTTIVEDSQKMEESSVPSTDGATGTSTSTTIHETKKIESSNPSGIEKQETFGTESKPYESDSNSEEVKD